MERLRWQLEWLVDADLSEGAVAGARELRFQEGHPLGHHYTAWKGHQHFYLFGQDDT